AVLPLQDDVAALGTERHLDGVGDSVDTPFKGAPRFAVESQLLCCHSFGPPSLAISERLLLNNREDVALPEDEVLRAVELHLSAAVLGEDDVVAHLDLQRHPLAVVQELAAADGDHFTLLRLLLGGDRK